MTNTVVEDLLKNHYDNYQVMWNKNEFHTHVAHHLGSLLLLGASDEQLRDIYKNTMTEYADKYHTSPHDITEDNWRESLGDKKFCTAYRNYFDQQLPRQGDWKPKFFEILLDDKEGIPLIDAVHCGVVHPLIHIDYAIELNSRPVACEALTLAAVCFDPLAEVSAHLKPPRTGSKTALQIIKDIRVDNQAPAYYIPGQVETAVKYETFYYSYYNDWKVPDTIKKTIEELFDMSLYIFAATHKPDQIEFDFILLHLITGMNAVRKIKHCLDEKTLTKLLYTFFFLAIMAYIAQKQPKINEELLDNYQIEQEKFNWEYVIDQTLNSKRATEVHFVKLIRALKDAEKDYGSKDGLYLKTAIKTVDNLNIDKPWDYYKSTEPWVGTPTVWRQLNVKY